MSGVEVSGAGAAREQMAEAIEEFGNFGQFFDEPRFWSICDKRNTSA
jgi:hypothetical protein